MDGEPIRLPEQRRKFEWMYETLRKRICLLDYAPGQRLSEEALAAEFGVSRTPLRRVLGRLEGEGLLKSVQSVGTIVTDADVEEMAPTYQLRMELAELIGRLSPIDVTPAHVDEFRLLLAECDRLSDKPDPRAFARVNMDFLNALLRLTENDALREISERLYYRTTRIWIKTIDQLDLAEEMQIFRREVADVLAAVELGDLEAVGHIRRSHISMSFARLRLSKKRQDVSS